MALFSKHISIIIGLLFSLGLMAQENIPLAKLGKEIPFKVFKTHNNNLIYSDIIDANIAFEESGSFKEKTHPNDTYWIRLDFEKESNILSKNATWYLNYNTFGYGELFYKKNNTIIKKPIGQFDSPTISEKIKSEKYFSEVSFTSNSLLSNRYLYLKVKRVNFLEHLNNWNFSYTENSIKDHYSSSETKSLLPIYVYTGIIAIMSIIMFVFFFYFKKMEFLFYSLYALALLLFMTKDEWQLFENLLPNDIFIKDWLLNTLQIFIPLGYLFFMIFYLNLKKDYPLAYKVIKAAIFIYLCLFVTDFLFFIFKYHIGHIYILKSFPFLGILIAVFSIPYLLIHNKNRISTLFIIGFFFFITGTGLHFYYNNDSDPLFYNNKIYFIIGSSIEIVIFALGLVYKIFTEHLDKINFQQEAALNKTKALRAQINPHFIFNSLSSIQHLVTKNDKVASLKYLTKFSRLTRSILESSIETSVVLADEIKMLKDYLELESLRFENAFSYHIKVDDNVEIDSIEVPFLIIQPFIENAILHGLLNKTEGTKELIISFKQELDYLICIVDDNGIGRTASSKKKTIYKNKSRGLEVTKERLQMINGVENNIEIIDKVDQSNKALGTKVIIKINLS